MRQTRRGSEVTPVPSNRAIFYSDATVDAAFITGTHGLLAAGASKTVPVLDFAGQQALANRVTIVNESSQDVTIAIGVCVNDDPEMSSNIEQPLLPLTIPSGEGNTFYVSAAQFIEKNIGSGAQTGYGVRYYVELERKQH